MKEQRFTDKIALVTGSSTGIGAAIATQLAAEGAHVALCGRRVSLLRAKTEALQQLGYSVQAIPGDVAVNAPEIVQAVISHFGQLDVLVNNAAASAGMGVDEMPVEAWRQVMAVNLDAAFAIVSQAIPHLAQTRGVILNISSISAVSGEFDDAAYAASKAGLEGFSRKLALELAPYGIRANAIRPGLIHTEAFADMPQDFFETQIPMIPLGKIGQPEDIAHAAAFLCSPEAQFITGSILTVDGGESAK